MKNVEGKVAFITAGASGIGWGMARAFMNAGMKVVCADILQEHIDECSAQYPGKNDLHFMKLDVANRKQMEDAATKVDAMFGRLDVLCNNAGVAARADIDSASYEDWDYTMNVCVGGTINGLVNFLPLIKKHGEGGHVVTTSSMAGMIPVPMNGIYSTAKFAVRGMMDALRLSLGPQKIGVSVLCPGAVATRAMTAGDKYRLAQEEGKILHEKRDPWNGGIDPLKIGERVLRAIQNNEMYIFPHGEFREELRAYFNRMLDAFPDDFGDADKVRLEFERRRMTMTEEARRVADAIDGAKDEGPSVEATVDAWLHGRQPQ